MTDANGSDITPLFPTEPARQKPRLKRLRLLGLLIPLALLAVVSLVFGMMMAVASGLPDLENRKEFESARNSVLYDVTGRRQLGVLTNNDRRVLVEFGQISPVMRRAIIAIEDRRFYENAGVDLRSVGRALVNDVIARRPTQGGSTIAQQFVKNALQAQDDRTVLQKLREATLAWHLTRKWSKEKILTQYLNSIYFGNGAYGVEAAARTYFGNEPDHADCGTRSRPCVSDLEPQEAALLAGMVASPSGYDPVAHPTAALTRRNLVLKRMLEQGLLSRLEYFKAIEESLPGDVKPPQVETRAPYFTTWVRQQLVDRFGARRAFEGGLKIVTTLDLDMQEAAEAAVSKYLANPQGPTAALVAIDNDTGEVRAMVGGRDYNETPFNLATQGQRQPGSSIKPFILAEALRQGIGPGSVWPSRKREFVVPGTKGRETFVVHNFEDNYAGLNTLAGALTTSDNSVFAAVGIKVGTKKISRLARRMGIRTPVSTNYAMTLGGLREGVTPLDMAHAFETFAAKGLRVSGTLGAAEAGPVGLRAVETLPGEDGDGGDVVVRNRPRRQRVLSPGVAQTATGIMATVVQRGTGRRAAFGEFAAGKTGTTENSGDAWFVGFSERWTVAVWVGYPDKLKPMLTEFGGKPVEGGTFPALIWHDFMVAADKLADDRAAKERERRGLPPKPEDETQTTPVAPVPTGPSEAVPEEGEPPVEPAPQTTPKQSTPAPTPTPEPEPEPEPQPTPTPAQPPTTTPTEPGTGDTGEGGAGAPPA